MESCISPVKEKFSASADKTGAAMTWLGEVADFERFDYAVEGTQLAMLKLRSPSAYQTVTVSCPEEVKLYSDNDIELSASDSHARFGVIADNCRVITNIRITK